MATLAAKAIRGAHARDELSAAIAELGARLGVAVPERPARSADPELQPILETEWQRDFVRAVNAALAGRNPQPTPEPIPAPEGDDEPETASESAQGQSRRQRGRNR